MERIIATKSVPTLYANSVRSTLYAKITKAGRKGATVESLFAVDGSYSALRYLLVRNYVRVA